MRTMLLVAAASLASAQATQPPEFRSDARLIRLDVSVVDGRGQPIAGLVPDDFTISEDGRPVEITYFEAVDDGAALQDDLGTSEEGMLVASVAPRRVVLLVDAAFMTQGQLIRARESAAR